MSRKDKDLVRYHHGLQFDYPSQPDAHIINPPPVRSVHLDEQYITTSET